MKKWPYNPTIIYIVHSPSLALDWTVDDQKNGSNISGEDGTHPSFIINSTLSLPFHNQRIRKSMKIFSASEMVPFIDYYYTTYYVTLTNQPGDSINQSANIRIAERSGWNKAHQLAPHHHEMEDDGNTRGAFLLATGKDSGDREWLKGTVQIVNNWSTRGYLTNIPLALPLTLDTETENSSA